MLASFAHSIRFAVERLEGRDMMSATFAGPTDVFVFGFQQEPNATHILYQDITIPTNHSITSDRTGAATLVGISDPTDDSKGQIVTINELNGVPAPQGKAVLHVRKAGDDKRQDY